MKNLIIIRHAKSSWEKPLLDRDRGLLSRGINDARLVATIFLKDLPQKMGIYCSPARRAKDTAGIFMASFSRPIETIIFKEELYTFNGSQLEKCIKSFNDDYDNVILFGHNEAITNFVNKFGDVFIDNVPTSGLVSIIFDCNNWKTISKGKTQQVVFPRDFKL